MANQQQQQTLIVIKFLVFISTQGWLASLDDRENGLRKLEKKEKKCTCKWMAELDVHIQQQEQKKSRRRRKRNNQCNQDFLKFR